MPLPVRKNIANLKQCLHGGIDYAELKALAINPGDIIDFSVSTNPFMPPDIKEIMSSTPVTSYPDTYSTLMRHRLSEKLGIDINNIVVGNGSTELIRLIALCYFRQNEPILIIEPTYGEYEQACRIFNARPLHYRCPEKNGFIPDIDHIIETIQKKRPRAVFLCNPNNPTGKYLKRRDIEKLIEAAANSLFVIDEAYVSFVEKKWNSNDLIKNDNVAILRSMTKDYGIPGLRLGYVVACQEIASILSSVMPPWGVNAVAQQTGIKLLENDKYLEESLQKTREASVFLREQLTRLGFNILATETHFFMIKVNNAATFRRSLLRKGIMVRDCSSFGLPQHIRISPRSLPHCRMLVKAITIILKSGSNVIL